MGRSGSLERDGLKYHPKRARSCKPSSAGGDQTQAELTETSRNSVKSKRRKWPQTVRQPPPVRSSARWATKLPLALGAGTLVAVAFTSAKILPKKVRFYRSKTMTAVPTEPGYFKPSRPTAPLLVQLIWVPPNHRSWRTARDDYVLSGRAAFNRVNRGNRTTGRDPG
jgi:hypothetical protein